jgi:hypothetical protein
MAAFIRNREPRDTQQVSASAILNRPHSRIELSHLGALHSPLIVKVGPNLVETTHHFLAVKTSVHA